MAEMKRINEAVERMLGTVGCERSGAKVTTERVEEPGRKGTMVFVRNNQSRARAHEFVADGKPKAVKVPKKKKAKK